MIVNGQQKGPSNWFGVVLLGDTLITCSHYGRVVTSKKSGRTSSYVRQRLDLQVTSLIVVWMSCLYCQKVPLKFYFCFF